MLLASAAVLPFPGILCDLPAVKPAVLAQDRPARRVAARATPSAGARQTATAAPFTRPLPIPPVLKGKLDETGVRNITVKMREADVPILPGRPTRMWTYDGVFPGPTIRLSSGHPARVKFVNELPSAAGAMTVHLHGGHNSARDDGHPHENLIAPGASRTYNYDLSEDNERERAAFKWYHDHRMDKTARNVWNGLAGMFILDDKVERRLPLPKGAYDVPLMITDRSFTADNQLTEPFKEKDPLRKLLPEEPVIGKENLVNGVSKPVFDVADRKYRLRVINASTFRWYDFRLSDDSEFSQIATESGLMPGPVRRRRILLGPAERAELVVDFRGKLGRNVTLETLQRQLLPDPTRTPAGPILQFRVSRHEEDPSSVPDTLRPLPDWVRTVSKSPTQKPDHVWSFGEGIDFTKSQFAHTINNQSFDPERIDARVKLDSVETWELRSNSPLAHWVHIHDVAWYVIARNGRPPGPGENVLKETFKLAPFERVLVAARFPDHRGKFMIHCHMLEHEDLGMMAQFEVVGPPDKRPPTIKALSFSRKVFRSNPRGRPPGQAARRGRARRHRRGSTVRFTLDEPAFVRFAVARRSAGRRVGRRCRPGTRANRRRRRCIRYLRVGAFVRHGAAEPNTVTFSGRLRSRGRLRHLKPGRYRLTAVATDSAGNRSPVRTRHFRVAPR